MQEWRTVPVGLLEEIIELRAFTQTWQAYNAADTKQKQAALPSSPLMDLARQIDGELAQEALDKANGKSADD